MLKRLFLIAMVVLTALTACKENETISRRYPCRFHFYREMHPTSLMFSAYSSPGTYVFVWTKIEVDVKKGTSYRYVYVQSNDGKTPTESNLINTQIESNVPYMLGASNEMGLIVGCTNFNGPVAYDRICPNCVGVYPLQWTGNRQQVLCNNCKRVYDLETAAITSGAEGDPLMRYMVSLDNLRLTVSN